MAGLLSNRPQVTSLLSNRPRPKTRGHETFVASYAPHVHVLNYPTAVIVLVGNQGTPEAWSVTKSRDHEEPCHETRYPSGVRGVHCPLQLR